MEYLRKYATATHVYVPIIKRAVVDFAVSADWTPAAGDVKISIDGGAAANVTNLPTAITMGNGAMWDFNLTSGEITGKKINVTVVDAATKAVEDQMFSIITFGNASAEYPMDFSDSVRAGLTALPNATPGAAGGIFIAGTNAAVTISSSGDALTITSTAANGNGINITGNGTGNGILSTGGATSGDGVHFGGGGTGHGIHALSGNGATGNGFRAASQATNGNGIAAAGNGTGDGFSITGGTTGNGLHAVGGSAAAAGDGILAAVLGTGVPIRGAITGNITGNLSGSVGSVTAGVTVTTNNDKTGYSLTQSFPANFASLGITAGGAVTIDGTSALAESYRANGAAPTLSQGIHEILAHLGESSISGTTKTIKKLDHATTAETFTLDSATTPASVTRAT